MFKISVSKSLWSKQTFYLRLLLKTIKKPKKNLGILTLTVFILFSAASGIMAIDGSGTNVVNPNSVNVGSTGNTETFTYTAAETMDSGGITITVPAAWTAPQGTTGIAGYTTASSTGTLADVVNNLDTSANWTATQHMSLSADTGDTQEGTASLANTITSQAAANEQWYFNYGTASNWGTTNGNSNLRVGYFLKSSINTASGDFSWQDDDTASLASPLDTIAVPALTANTWTYTSATLLGATRGTINSYGFRYTNDIGAATLKVDSISTIFDPADSITGWSSDGSINRSLLTTSGNFKEGTAAIRCAYLAGAGIGTNGDCFDNEGAAFTSGPGTTVSFWIRSSVALNAGDFAYVDDDSANLASVRDTINLPAISANTWTYIILSAPNSGSMRSYGLRQRVDKGALNIDIDAIGKQVNANDSITGWNAPTSSVQSLTLDSTVKQEGTNSLKNTITASAAIGDTWYQTFASSQNWSSYTTVGFWIRSTVATTAGQLKFEYSSNSDLSSPIASINIGALLANTWTYQKLTLTGTRTAVNSYGINYATDIGAATVYLDDVLIGPGSITFPGGGVIGARILSLSSSQTITIVYGSGGGASGTTAPATAEISTFTTQSRSSDAGTLTNIALSPTVSVNNPVPTTISINPTSKTAGDTGFSLTVNGTNFVSSSVVNFSGSARVTTYVSSTQLTAAILTSDLTTPGSFNITVINPTPGGGTSNAQTLTVNNPVPTTTSINPTFKTVGDPGFTLTVNGTNFVSNSVVDFAGSGRSTTFVNSTQLTASILISDLTSAGTFNITVTNPTPGGGTSNAQTFTVNNPIPTTTSIDPVFKTAGDAGFSLTVNGTNFVSSSVVNFEASPRSTTYVSSAQLTASILTSDLTTPGTFNITVTNPTPGGGTSNAQTLTINPATSKFVIIDPTDGTVDNPVTVTVQAQKTDNSIDTAYQQDVTLNTTGSATGGGLVDIVNGVGTLNISDHVAETIGLSLTDSQGTGLNVSSSQNLIFAPGAIKNYSLNDISNMFAKTRAAYIVSRSDQYNNLVSSGTSTVYLYSSSTSSTKKFYDAATNGNIITSIIVPDGQSSVGFWYYDEEGGTYTITASDNATAPDGIAGINDGTDSIIVIPIATKFVIIDPTDGTVDNPISVTVQAQKPDNSIDTNYQEDITLNVSGSATGGGLVNITNGVGTRNISDTVAETVNLSLTDSQGTGLDISSTQQVIFSGGALSQFSLNDPGTLSAGSRIGYTVTRKDQYNNLTTSGVSTVYLYSTSLSANKKFYDADTAGNIITSINITDGNSSANFWYYDETPGTYTITASDNATAPDGNTNVNDASDSIDVTSGPVSLFLLNDPGDVYIDTRVGYTITRKDAFNNLASSGINTVYLFTSSTTGTFYNASSGGSAITSVDITNGNSSANFWYSDSIPGTYTVTASDNSSTPDGAAGITDGTDSVIISSVPIVATRFVILNPTDGTVDNPVTVTVQAQDDSGNIDTTYQTDVTLNTTGSATGGGVVDIINGIGTLSLSDTLAETVNLSLTDSQATGLNVSSIQDVVFSVGNVYQFSLNNPGDMVAGTRLGYTVTRKDQFGNLITSGLTTVYLYGVPALANKKFYDSASGGSVITFIDITNGNSSANFWYYDETADTSTVVVSDNASSPDGVTGIVDATDQTAVSAAATARFIINNPGDMTAGTRLGYAVSRKDQFNNSVTMGVSMVYLYTSSSGANARFYDSGSGGLIITALPIDNGNSSANFWYYDESAGTWTITVSDSTPSPDGNTGIIDDVDSVIVSNIPIVATKFVILDPGPGRINVPLSVTIQAQDNANNIDTTYQNDVTLNITGSATGEGLVDIVDGTATISINDNIVETVTLTLADTGSTGLDVTSSRLVTFSTLEVFNVGGVVTTAPLPKVGKVSFSGRAYPQASLSMIAVKEGEDQVIKTDSVTSSDGSFTIEFSGLSLGSRSYALRVQDKDGREAQIKTFDLNLINADSELNVNDILISPTLGFPRSNITRGDFLAIIGYATPGSGVDIVIDGQPINAEVVAQADGSYKYLYNTALLELGSHTISARQIFNGTESEFSPQHVFFTTNLTVPQTDLNNDGQLNISDWSIFLARWFSTDPATKLLDDFNKDGKVDATDFSIFIRTLRR